MSDEQVSDAVGSETRDWFRDEMYRREDYDRAMEREVSPLLRAEAQSDRAAIDFAQSVIKNGQLLNGGAVIALPAVVALFNLDATAVQDRLLVAGGCFAAGLISGWLAGIGAFFALARRSDSITRSVQAARERVHRGYYPNGGNSTTGTEQGATSDANRLRRSFIRWRIAAIIFCMFGLLSFLGGGFVASWTVLTAPHKMNSLK